MWFRSLPGDVIVYDVASLILVLKGDRVIEAWSSDEFYQRYPFLRTIDGWTPLKEQDIRAIDMIQFLREALGGELPCVKVNC